MSSKRYRRPHSNSSKRRGRIASNLHAALKLTAGRELMAEFECGFTRGACDGVNVTFIPWNNGKSRDVL